MTLTYPSLRDCSEQWYSFIRWLIWGESVCSHREANVHIQVDWDRYPSLTGAWTPRDMWTPSHTSFPFYLHMSTYPSPSPKLILLSSLHIYLFLGTQPRSALSQLPRFLTLTVSLIILLPVCRGMLSLNHFNHVPLFATLWTIAHQAPLSMRFSRQEHWSGLPCPPAGDPPYPGTESASLMSPASPALASGFFTTGATWESSFRESSLSPESLIPPSWSSWGLFVFIFLDCPGVSDTTESFHLGTLSTKPLFHLFLCSVPLPPDHFFLAFLSSSFPYGLWRWVFPDCHHSCFLPFLPSVMSSVSQTLTAANILITQKFAIFLEPIGQFHLDILKVIAKLMYPQTNSLARFFLYPLMGLTSYLVTQLNSLESHLFPQPFDWFWLKHI